MTEKTEAELIQTWTDSFIEIVKRGADPGAAADCMLSVAGLLLAHHRGTSAARLALQVGADFMARREQPTSEPSPGDALH